MDDRSRPVVAPPSLLADRPSLTGQHYPDSADLQEDALASHLGLLRFPTTKQHEWLRHRQIFLAAQPPTEILRALRQLKPAPALLDSFALRRPRAPPP